jgi:hypothetical protein
MWTKPSLEHEMSELERTAKEEKIELQKLMTLFHAGRLEELTEQMWASLENTSSWTATNMSTTRRIADQTKRSMLPILDGFRKGKDMEAPIILLRDGKKPYLVSGNTRLMICRAKRITPKVYVLGDCIKKDKRLTTS